jgi:methylphosphotriester-DNA--protein-cysteine methyltransferase
VPYSFSARLHEPAVPAPDTKVQAALRLVAAEQSGERSILDLAAELGISLRSLELGFRRELDTTPHDYLRTSRLARVHEELARADVRRTTVSAIAGKWGFAHHGRFAPLTASCSASRRSGRCGPDARLNPFRGSAVGRSRSGCPAICGLPSL